ncbi:MULTISPECIES: hypothetical protein [Pseudomonas]|uniref:hypothetical protein n=1 Tax=Pseudomonas TaxID=286 RepID=UPI001F375E67|nr:MULTISPECIES: hypothetical protein [Pseudomonas]
MDAAAKVSANTLVKTNTWVLVFVFCFLGLLIDGADLMLLSYSLSSLKAEFGLSNVEAGSLGSFTLAGMAIGGIYGGWACDRFRPGKNRGLEHRTFFRRHGCARPDA